MNKLEKYEIKRLDPKSCLIQGNVLHYITMDELYCVISDFQLNDAIITQKMLKHIISYNIKYNLALELRKIQDSDRDIIDNHIQYYYNGIYYYDVITDIIEMINLIDIKKLCNILDDIEIYKINSIEEYCAKV